MDSIDRAEDRERFDELLTSCNIPRPKGHSVTCLEEALAAAKDLIRAVNHQPINETLVEETAHRIAHLRATPEAREGIAAFLDKRQPSWMGE